MKPDGPIKVVSGLLDLPILDSEGRSCGIVDDVEFSGTVGKPLGIKAILVGPGSYKGRMPGWMFAVAKWIAGDQMVRIPWSEVAAVRGAVELKCPAKKVGLHKVENRVRAWIPRHGAK